MEKIYSVAVVGGGIAGYSAALALKSLKTDFIWLGAKGYGEKLNKSEYIRNYPSFTGDGREFSAALEAQRAHEGVSLTEARIDGIYAVDGEFLLTQNKTQYRALSVILATGVETAGSLKGENEFLGRGVSYCAVCDGALYRGKKIAVVLSSAEYADEAEYLAGFADEVFVFCTCKPPVFRAENITVREGVPLAVEGGARVERLVLKEGTLPVSGVFFLKNSAPPSALVGGLETEGAHVRVTRGQASNLKGLFAAGDVTGRPYQYVKAAGEGCVAAYSANAYVKSLQKNL